MKNFIKSTIILLLMGSPIVSQAQDMNFNVNIITTQVQLSDKSIFTSLQNSVIQFLNGRKWSKDRFLQQERIAVNMIIEVTSYDPGSNAIIANFQIQSLRPVYKSGYTTMLTNFRDEGVAFTYQAFQSMDFQENNNVYNLTGVLAYYAYIIMGIDYDSFGEFAGTPYYQQAKGILDASQNIQGWRPNDGQRDKNRYYLLDNLLSDRFKPLRSTIYQYHRKGLDMMYKDVSEGRKAIEESLKNIENLCRTQPNSMMVRNFFLVKHLELIEIYKEATVAEKNRIIEMLKKMDVANAGDYDKIRQS
ncbi:MAG: DUF4835 family protein [Bacteroidetes bacterium]|nr:DUF4835 family protein [Bacteroidota bacterium]